MSYQHTNYQYLEPAEKAKIMANYKRCNTKPIRIVGKKTGYTVCGIPIIYTRSFYEHYSFDYIQDLVGSYLLSDLKGYVCDVKGEEWWVDELLRHMELEDLVHWEYYDKPTKNTIIDTDAEWPFNPGNPLHKELVHGPFQAIAL